MSSTLKAWPLTARPRAWEFLLLLALPLALLASAFSLRDAGGPYWLSSNLDPSYAYLFNSLNLANLRRPEHTDHPGTPVQMAGAGLIRLHNLSADEDATARAVVADPEAYIREINNLLVVVCALALLAAGLLARASGGLAFGVLAQTPPFLFLSNVAGLVGIRPESLLLALSVLLGAASLVALRRGESGQNKTGRGVAVALGAIFGLGVATKLTFVPLVLLPLAALPGWRRRALMLVCALITFFVAVASSSADKLCRRIRPAPAIWTGVPGWSVCSGRRRLA
ncbi:MAG TPA: hypothetical protein VGV38_15260, partial [Pyrinomonadaceae bacterium]|nr:hypothetical protein [Pyrinomonadaceae bacterium]